MDKLKSFKSSSIFLPLVALAILVIFNIIFVPDFLDVEITQDGRLYGRVFDILNRSSSLIILSLGMTFVIATAGIDISVGAVVAISGAVCCSLIGGRGDGVAEYPMVVAMIDYSYWCCLRYVEWVLSSKDKDTTDGCNTYLNGCW